MNEYPNIVKEKLTSLINGMSRDPALFVKNPERDFTRKRKLCFKTMMQLLISMGGNCIYKELLEAQGYDANTATTAAFVQQREKILLFAFEFLLHEFTQSFSNIKKYKGFRLLAVDGSDLHIATDPESPDTYFQNRPDEKGFNLLHLNAMYDLCNRLYVDSCVQPRRCINECRALTDMVDRSCIKDNVIVIADRGFESYNCFAHIEKKGWNYVIRVKDTNSSGILSGLQLPASTEFDITVQRILTKKYTREIREHLELYRPLNSDAPFDFLDQDTRFYSISLRIVRFKITEDSYETVITNLNQSDFSPGELKELYKKRWGIETSFRELKYSIGLTHFHAKKQEYIAQEIFARMIMYNFSEMITSHVVINQKNAQYLYQVNFTVAIHICKYFLRCCNNALSSDVEALIQKNILPIRPGRKNYRRTRIKSAVSFIYRVA